jgi:hypothetical protein
MSAASLATSVAVWTEIPTSASWSATASLTPSPRKPAEGPLGLDEPRFLLRGHAREDRRARQRGRELGVVKLIEPGACERPLDGQADVGADLLRDAVVVAGDDLHLHVEAPQALERLLGVGLRAIDEREEAREVQFALVVGVQGRAVLGAAGSDGDHAAARGELAVEHSLRSWSDVRAAGEQLCGLNSRSARLPPGGVARRGRARQSLCRRRFGSGA